MDELTIRSGKAQRNLLEWSQRVADCRSSGQSLTRCCAEHNIKPKTYFSWQKKVFTTMIEQQRAQAEKAAEAPEGIFAELPVPEMKVEKRLVAELWKGTAHLDVYSGASPEVVATLCLVLKNAT